MAGKSPEEKAAEKAAKDAAKAEAKAKADAAKAAAKAVKEAEKAAAQAAKNGDTATVVYPGGERTYTRAEHGEDFAAHAAEFAAKRGGTVK